MKYGVNNIGSYTIKLTNSNVLYLVSCTTSNSLLPIFFLLLNVSLLVLSEMSVGGFELATSPPSLHPSPTTGPTLYLLHHFLLILFLAIS